MSPLLAAAAASASVDQPHLFPGVGTGHGALCQGPVYIDGATTKERDANRPVRAPGRTVDMRGDDVHAIEDLQLKLHLREVLIKLHLDLTRCIGHLGRDLLGACQVSLELQVIAAIGDSLVRVSDHKYRDDHNDDGYDSDDRKKLVHLSTSPLRVMDCGS